MAKTGRKHSDLEKQERILYILELRSKGVKGTSDLFRFFSEKYPDLTKRQFEYDLKEAKELIATDNQETIDFQVSEIDKHLWELYNKSLKLQDYRECRNILKDLSALKGLLVKHVDVKSGGEKIEGGAGVTMKDVFEAKLYKEQKAKENKD